MNKISCEDINKELRILWKETIDSGKWPKELADQKYWPLEYPKEIETPTLVFVGMNPAFTERDAKKTQEQPITDTKILLLENGRALICKDTECPPSNYFKPFDQFIDGTKLKWTHIDIFAVKHTTQDTVKRALGLDSTWTEFTIKQFNIFKKLLEKINPPIIVVPNAFASYIIKNDFKASEMDADCGCNYIHLNGKQVPIFFSGMLTGQRALDNFSEERLVNLVRKKIKQLGF